MCVTLWLFTAGVLTGVFSVIVGRAEGRTLVRVVGVAVVVAAAVVTVVVLPLAGAGVLGAGAGFSLGAGAT